jgi:8-oxo-dGTP pyrophosphatase MutT (NUDIX family)
MRENPEVTSNAITEKLSNTLKQNSETSDADAAVVVLLKAVNQDLQVLLVKRAEKPTDPWSGQTAFPGGKRSPEDKDMKETVARETLEETSINLLDGCCFLGTMEPLSPTQKPEMTILPFVVLLEKEQPIRLNEELTEYFWVPMQKLVHSKGTVNFSFGDVSACIIEGNIIWGLTYRILDKLFSML